MQRLQSLLPKESVLQLVSISVDPTHDVPAVLAQYAQQYNAEPGRWRFLTGDPADIARLMQQGFKLPFDGSMIHHSEKLVLVDGKGQIRGYYDALDEQDLQRLITEISREGTTL
jgi:protein SCO1/2